LHQKGATIQSKQKPARCRTKRDTKQGKARGGKQGKNVDIREKHSRRGGKRGHKERDSCCRSAGISKGGEAIHGEYEVHCHVPLEGGNGRCHNFIRPVKKKATGGKEDEKKKWKAPSKRKTIFSRKGENCDVLPVTTARGGGE